MKKILSILFMCALFYTGFAQNPANFYGTTSKPGTSTSTTITGTAISVTTLEIPLDSAEIDTLGLTMSGNYNALVKVQARVLKGTGTIAGTVRLYGSQYGTTSTWTAIGDTLTLSNAAVNEHTWNLTGNDLGWKYLRVLQSGGTTMTGTISVRALGIKPE